MLSTIVFAVISMGLVSLAAVGVQQYLFRRDDRICKEEEIRKAARDARSKEKERIRMLKRLGRQDALGDRVYWSLYGSWKRVGRPVGLEPRRIRHNFGAAEEGNYYIEIGGDGTDPIETIFWICLDLRRTGKELSVTGDSSILDGSSHREFPAEDGAGFVRIILAEKVFGSRAA